MWGYELGGLLQSRRTNYRGRELMLHALTPSFEEQKHGAYLKILEEAAADTSPLNNIAITGGYGVGKSSLLQEFRKRQEKKAVAISLSSLGAERVEESGNKTLTNLIQKEIVKQILYTERPSKMNRSRFQRISKPEISRTLIIGAFTSISILILSIASNHFPRIDYLFHLTTSSILYRSLFFLFFFILLFGSHRFLAHRIRITNFKVSEFEIKLEENENSYFDKFIDEIFYFFCNSGKRIVIIEDLDRFDDPYIFETLRTLNLLLNNSKQIAPHRIKFVYAIKDSIFELSKDKSSPGDSLPESSLPNPLSSKAATNRTKFFDLVIPIIPFISHTNARDLLKQEMSDTNSSISLDLLKLVASEIPDMRLIKNIRNEFLVFKEILIDQHENSVQLSEDELFAMILYKNTHLKDFERTSGNLSHLDTLYAQSRTLIRAASSRLRDEYLEMKSILEDEDLNRERGEQLGSALNSYANDTFRYLANPGGGLLTYSLGSTASNHQEVLGVEFWQNLANQGTGALEIRYSVAGATPQVLRVPVTELPRILNQDILITNWTAIQTRNAEIRLAEIDSELQFLAFASYSQLFSNPKYQDNENRSFSEIVATHFQSNLALKLISQGFITKNYALYTSNYYSNLVSANAKNFQLQCIERNLIDFDFQLSAEEVDSLLSESDVLSLISVPSFFNLSVLNRLLEIDDKRLQYILDPSHYSSGDYQFYVVEYLRRGSKKSNFVKMVTPHWRGVFDSLYEASGDSEESLLQLTDAALSSLNADLLYELQEALRERIRANVVRIPILSSTDLNVEEGRRIVEFFSDMEIFFDDVTELHSSIRNLVIEACAFDLNVKNLKFVCNGATPELIEIRGANPYVFEFVLTNFSVYLFEMATASPPLETVSNLEDFHQIFNDLLGLDAFLIGDFLDSLKFDYRPLNLDASSIEAWPVFAVRNAFKPTYENIVEYLDKYDEVDESLGIYLSSATSIIVGDDIDEDSRLELAIKVIEGRTFLKDDQTCVNLLESLALEEDIDFSLLPQITPSLLGTLLKKGLIEDSKENYAQLTTRDWGSRESFIENSKSYADFLVPNIFSPTDFLPLLRSPVVPEKVKRKVLTDLDQYVPVDDLGQMTEAVKYMVKNKISASYVLCVHILASQIDQGLKKDILFISLTNLKPDEISSLFKTLGSYFSVLVAKDGRHPKIPDTVDNRRLLDTLKNSSFVSSYRILKNGQLEVYLRKN